MKRSKMLREIVKVLKPWENSVLEVRTAKEILAKIEELGMLPPGREEDEITATKLDGTVIGYSHEKHIWDKERK